MIEISMLFGEALFYFEFVESALRILIYIDLLKCRLANRN